MNKAVHILMDWIYVCVCTKVCAHWWIYVSVGVWMRVWECALGNGVKGPGYQITAVLRTLDIQTNSAIAKTKILHPNHKRKQA